MDSGAGRFYGQVCQFWGLDPGAALEGYDDVLAANLRAALALALAREEQHAEMLDEAGRHVELVQRAQTMGAEVRKVTHG